MNNEIGPFQRARLIEALEKEEKWDVIVVGGGATGLGVALDSVSRGYKTLVLEQADFAKGTSSRSTKLVHGGVRYLAQGNIGLVREALRERGLLLKNAPHLVKNQSFVIPNYRWWGGVFYTFGLKIYDLLAGSLSLGSSVFIRKGETLKRIPTVKKDGLRGGVLYHDGQFDDSRMAVNLAQTCIEHGAVVLNYAEVNSLLKKNGHIDGVVATDKETGKVYNLKGEAVVNATGIFVDNILRMEKPDSQDLVRPSQGVHLVLNRSFLPGEDAVMIPKTDDGRVLFAVPWHNKVVIGTTDTPLDEHSLEPRALEEEIVFILNTSGRYLSKKPRREDVLSVFAGLRPLAATQGDSGKTKEISRSHKILVSEAGLITITGGKWTTFRKMGEDTIKKAISLGRLPDRDSKSETLSIHGAKPGPDFNDPLYVYGSDREKVLALIEDNPELGQKLDDALEYRKAEVIWAARHEMARTVEDVLARRTRALFLDARAAVRMAGETARLMAEELGYDEQWQKEQVQAFEEVAENYII
ncbi:glycerol-3-phosphate dehydrogenase/oxidase [Sinomicrobium weinanense]|uniref:Glycerol-3-phosphate dehydrogenase/oxidase n=1 Tax=Sinomicrobium weinanense TaxID=2842200 RepID=A0A926JQC2_9FLAO|nr:glycerol-3-phosphate dehydrogenase/oxidase [Sinomicrobium weinanense]MBC9795306.1 glycerol-3-phosphate dehydrogenase/oxidase [Sinomicrobium weinanense]MBU3125778.1 glycerol-3-phosphate dehydrogenase/oxidase [Sinomicrobium weinanense]